MIKMHPWAIAKGNATVDAMIAEGTATEADRARLLSYCIPHDRPAVWCGCERGRKAPAARRSGT